jgi:hypothetical protein
MDEQPLLKIVDAHPARYWNSKSKTLLVPFHMRNFVGVIEVAPVLRPRNGEREAWWARNGCHLMVGFNQRERRAWCKVLLLDTISCVDDETLWPEVANAKGHTMITLDCQEEHQVQKSSTQQHEGVTLLYGLVGDEVSVIVEVGGLVDV